MAGDQKDWAQAFAARFNEYGALLTLDWFAEQNLKNIQSGNPVDISLAYLLQPAPDRDCSRNFRTRLHISGFARAQLYSLVKNSLQ
jgi:hypothetical protein